MLMTIIASSIEPILWLKSCGEHSSLPVSKGTKAKEEGEHKALLYLDKTVYLQIMHMRVRQHSIL